MESSLADVAAAYKIVQLLDGRSLSYREYGDPSGVPVIFYHGTMNSRLFMPAWEKTQEVTAAAGVRLIAVDRPGYGFSTFQQGRRYMDNGAELCAVLAGVKGLAGQKVVLLGWSSGGPNALAAAHALALMQGAQAASPVAAVGIVSSDGPYVEMDPGIISSEGPHFNHGLPITEEEAVVDSKAAYAGIRRSLEGMAKRPERQWMATKDLEEAMRQGIAQVVQDRFLERTYWDFRLEDLCFPVLLWHGMDDNSVPPSVARHIAARLPKCKTTFLDGETHTMVRRQWGAILAALKDALQSGSRL